MNAITTLTTATEPSSAVATAADAFASVHADYVASCRADVDEQEMDSMCDAASNAFHALLAIPATNLADTAHKLIAVATWSDGSVIENEEVEGIADEMKRIMTGEA